MATDCFGTPVQLVVWGSLQTVAVATDGSLAPSFVCTCAMQVAAVLQSREVGVTLSSSWIAVHLDVQGDVSELRLWYKHQRATQYCVLCFEDKLHCATHTVSQFCPAYDFPAQH